MPSTAPQELGWASGFNAPGMDNAIEALAAGSDGSLYAGGIFTLTGGVTVRRIARWDGAPSSWHGVNLVPV